MALHQRRRLPIGGAFRAGSSDRRHRNDEGAGERGAGDQERLHPPARKRHERAAADGKHGGSGIDGGSGNSGKGYDQSHGDQGETDPLHESKAPGHGRAEDRNARRCSRLSSQGSAIAMPGELPRKPGGKRKAKPDAAAQPDDEGKGKAFGQPGGENQPHNLLLPPRNNRTRSAQDTGLAIEETDRQDRGKPGEAGFAAAAATTPNGIITLATIPSRVIHEVRG